MKKCAHCCATTNLLSSIHLFSTKAQSLKLYTFLCSRCTNLIKNVYRDQCSLCKMSCESYKYYFNIHNKLYITNVCDECLESLYNNSGIKKKTTEFYEIDENDYDE